MHKLESMPCSRRTSQREWLQGTCGTAGALTMGASEGAAWEGDNVLVADISGGFWSLWCLTPMLLAPERPRAVL